MAEQSIEERREDEKKARALHASLDLIGLRAQATAAGFLQLCAELRRAGTIDDDAVNRIKEAIARDIIVSRTSSHGRDAFEQSLRKRLDDMFAQPDDGNDREAKVGSYENLPAEFAQSDEDVEPEAHPS